MKSIAAILRLYFLAFPIQRWLGLIALALTVMIVLITAVRMDGIYPTGLARIAPLNLSLLAALFLLPSLFTTGPLFRYLSAPTSYRLLPHFRARMLAAVMFWLVLMVGLPATLAGFVVQETRALPPLVPLATIFAFVSGGFYFCYRLMTPSLRAAGDFAVLLLLIVANVLHDRVIPGSGFAFGAILFLIAAWIVFAFWYWRGGRVAPVDLLAGGAFRNAPASDANEQNPGSAPGKFVAVSTLLAGQSPMASLHTAWNRRAVLRLLALVALVIAAGVLLSRPGDSGSAGRRFPIELIAVWGAAFGIAFSVQLMATRTRRLWLLLGPGRRSVLHELEARAGRLALIGIPFAALVLLGTIAWVPDLSLRYGAMVFSLGLGLGASALYIGLVRARNPGVIETVGWVISSLATLASYFAYASGAWPGMWQTVVLVQLLAAAGLRQLAVRRWKSVDWLRLQAARFGLSNPA